MKIQVLDEAQQDLIDGYFFYELQDKGLGEYFLDSIYSDIESLHLVAGVHLNISGHYRLLSKRFPYGIYYKINNGTALIYAILDCRRNPSWIKEKLGK
jgi:hypothetical protein